MIASAPSPCPSPLDPSASDLDAGAGQRRLGPRALGKQAPGLRPLSVAVLGVALLLWFVLAPLPSAPDADSTLTVARAVGFDTPPIPATLIDVNKASLAELCALPGVGPGLAARIVADRRERGGFSSVEDLARVRGIGPAIVERVRPFVRVE